MGRWALACSIELVYSGPENALFFATYARGVGAVHEGQLARADSLARMAVAVA